MGTALIKVGTALSKTEPCSSIKRRFKVAKIRKDGEILPGIKWCRFTMRIPFYYVKLTLPEALQGGLITLTTAWSQRQPVEGTPCS